MNRSEPIGQPAPEIPSEELPKELITEGDIESDLNSSKKPQEVEVQPELVIEEAQDENRPTVVEEPKKEGSVSSKITESNITPDVNTLDQAANLQDIVNSSQTEP